MANPGLDFKVNPSDYLGLNHDEFKNDLLALSFGAPSKYIQLRKAVTKSLKTDFTNNIYKTFYNMLTKGTNLAGNVPVDISTAIDGTALAAGFKPNVPQQIVSEIALGIAKEFDQKINEIIDKYLIPVDNLNLAHSQTRKEEQGLRVGA